jgi:hypothetical protein
MQIQVSMKSESRGRKKAGKKGGGNKRSQMLRMIMPLMSHTTGEQLANAIDGNNVERLREVWSKIGGEIARKLEMRAKKGSVI